MTLTRALKVHLRVFELHRTTLRVVTLRPQTAARFSTNYFHDTWHILAGTDGAVLLGRLLWGLAFQRQPGTLVLIDGTHLVPTPFEGDPPDPILLVPDGLTRIDDDLLRALKLRLRRAPGSPTTIRWHTFGMAAGHDGIPRHDRGTSTREQMSRRAGFVCYTAPPAILRAQGLGIHATHQSLAPYYPLAVHHGRRWGFDGEFQVIPSFDRDVSAATVARTEILGDATRSITTDAEREAIYDRKDRVDERRR